MKGRVGGERVIVGGGGGGVAEQCSLESLLFLTSHSHACERSLNKVSRNMSCKGYQHESQYLMTLNKE